MKSLALPEQSAKEDKVLVSVCKTNSWLLHQSEWQATYDNYRLHKGNPWFVTPSSALSAISAKQKKLYDNRCKGGPIRRIRSTKNLVCCPMCGSPTTGSVDHYLPRAVFPEFSILYSNLVPACTHCNSAQKGDLYRGAGCERFIHPYYDAFADQPLWYVSVVPPYRAATFKAKALGGMPAQQTQIVQFHLKHILGEQFTEWVRTQWVRYPAVLARREGKAGNFSPDSIASHLSKDIGEAEMIDGVNGWRTALYRGVALDHNAMAHVASEAALV